MYLVDYEQTTLVPVSDGATAAREPVAIEGTLHGRAFATTSVLQAAAEQPDQRRLIIPLIDGTERLGTIEFVLSGVDDGISEEHVLLCEVYAHLAAQTVVTKRLYGDELEWPRRSQRMDVAGELIWRMLPPLVFATEGLIVAGLLEPCYAPGGDCFDYAVNAEIAHFAIFDAMGHGLPAAGVSSFAVSAYRNARLARLDLVQTYHEMDEAIAQQDGERYVSAILAELDRATGQLRWISAGHPPPLLLRAGKVIKSLEAEANTPLGVPFQVGEVTPTEEWLEPGDTVLLYTDGLPEARLANGEFFGTERLGEFIERESAAGYTAPETLRRLRNAVLQHQHGDLQDDATALLFQWTRGGERQLVPQPA